MLAGLSFAFIIMLSMRDVDDEFVTDKQKSIRAERERLNVWWTHNLCTASYACAYITSFALISHSHVATIYRYIYPYIRTICTNQFFSFLSKQHKMLRRHALLRSAAGVCLSKTILHNIHIVYCAQTNYCVAKDLCLSCICKAVMRKTFGAHHLRNTEAYNNI